MIGTARPHEGLAIAEGVVCAKCAGPLFIIPAPCFLKRKGWATAGKCMRGCGYFIGLTRRVRR